jgi:hypothetical protein
LLEEDPYPKAGPTHLAVEVPSAIPGEGRRQLHAGKRPLLVACIPCLNEEGHIASVILGAQEQVDRVIVCDDGSTDRTAEIAEKLGAIVIRHETNLGKGVALADLLKISLDLGATAAVTLDGDGQHNPAEIPFLLQPILDGKADVVNGAREKGGEMPGHRKLGNRVLNDLTNRAAKGNLRDSQSGFRAFSRKALEEVAVTEHGIGVESQMIIDAVQKGLRVMEVPVDVIYGEGSSTYGSARHGTYVVGTILRTVAERSPLLYLGVPGIAAIIAGIITGVQLLTEYNTTRYWSMPWTVITVGFAVLGVLLILAALLLYSINNLEVRLRNTR